jgi:hypothetical protein
VDIIGILETVGGWVVAHTTGELRVFVGGGETNPHHMLSGDTCKVTADCLTRCHQVHDWTTITRKTGKETRKRAIVLRDDSNRSIEVTLWGSFTEVPGNDLEQVGVYSTMCCGSLQDCCPVCDC